MRVNRTLEVARLLSSISLPARPPLLISSLSSLSSSLPLSLISLVRLSLSSTQSFHVPVCDWYNNGTAPRCSGFYHDQEQTPEHPGGGAPYRVDGDCIEQVSTVSLWFALNALYSLLFSHSSVSPPPLSYSATAVVRTRVASISSTTLVRR